ncbi:MAG: metabolite traffic protein EboE [Planctomycetes bacterium]|nr:metabolite traffic protein EboE [Planctomycetota bacterium]
MSRIPLRSGEAHLTYCQNVHAVESADAILDALGRWGARAAREVFGAGPAAAGLRLGAEAAAIFSTRDGRARLGEALSRANLYALTVNAFPYGAFQEGRVKEQVFAPPWTDEARLAYTSQVVTLLADLMPDGIAEGTVSTSPGTFRPWGDDREVRERIAENLARAAERAWQSLDRTGRSVRVCLEPEPFGTLQTQADALAFFEGPLRVHAARWLSRRRGYPQGRAEGMIQEHLGVCLDTCHALVAHEDPSAALSAFRRADVAVGKIQISNALHLPGGGADRRGLSALREYGEDRFFHQVVAQGSDGAAIWHVDLEALLSGWPDVPLPDAWKRSRDWRVHFHVPLFADALEGVPTLQEPLATFLAWLGAQKGPHPHLEVETYTWSLLPRGNRPPPDEQETFEGICAELRWAMKRMQETGDGRQESGAR